MSTKEIFESEENKLLEEGNNGGSVTATTTSASSITTDNIIDDDAVALLEGDYDNETNKETKNGTTSTYSSSFFNYDEEFELDYSEDELLRDDEPVVTSTKNDPKKQDSISEMKETDKAKESSESVTTSKETGNNKSEIPIDDDKKSSESKEGKAANGKRNPITFGGGSKKTNKHHSNKKRNFDKGPRYDKSKVILRTSFVGPNNCQPIQQRMMVNNQNFQNPRRFNGPQMVNNSSFNGFPNVNPFGPAAGQQSAIMGMNQRSGIPPTGIMGNNPFGPNPGMAFPSKTMMSGINYGQPRSMMPTMAAAAAPPMTGINMMGYQYSGQMLPQGIYTGGVVMNPTMQIDWSKLADEFSGAAERGIRSRRRSRHSSCSSYSSSDGSRRSRSSRDSSSDSQRRHRKRKSSRKDRKSRKRDSRRRSRSYSSDRKRKDDHRRKDRSRSEERKRRDKNNKKSNPTLECAKIVGVDKDYLRKVEQQQKLREEVLRKKRNNEKIDPKELKIEEVNPENVLKAYLVVSIEPSPKTEAWSFGNPKEKLTVIAKTVGKVKKVWKKGEKMICIIFESHNDATKFSHTYDGKTVNGTKLDVRLDKCRLILSKIS
uniref:RRM domain-containing protein n=1 Tax=Strongyloides papillosus TaxID=174720 RepID=A0A0N5BUY2_STREA